ncbi:DoxX family protein [Burkholderia gladioli]|uniref:DoxX family protein n=1 Tax=Burkholderia gladioli TaxID=28095 RepID=UPI00163F09E5|nr:DoxX family membrane protein [Burkholderia gladioli]
MNIFHTLRRIALVQPSSAYPASWPIALMRIATGIFFSTSGFNKLVLSGNRAAMLQTVTEAQVPCPELMAPFVAGCECLFGLLLALGLGTRPAALVLFAISGVALAPSGFTIPAGLGPIGWTSWLLYLPESLYLLITLVLLVRGGESLSLDAVWARRLARRA